MKKDTLLRERMKERAVMRRKYLPFSRRQTRKTLYIAIACPQTSRHLIVGHREPLKRRVSLTTGTALLLVACDPDIERTDRSLSSLARASTKNKPLSIRRRATLMFAACGICSEQHHLDLNDIPTNIPLLLASS